MGFSVERTGFVSAESLANSLIGDLQTNGFTMVHPTVGFSDTVFDAVLEAGPTVDSLTDGALPEEEQQPCRLKIKVDSGADPNLMRVFCATPIQIDDSGNTVDYDADWQSGELQKSSSERYFLDRSFGAADEDPEAHTMAYRLTIVERGIAFLVWQENSHHKGDRFSWFVIQRPVNHDTGLALTTGKAPLFCVYSVGGQEDSSFKFIVREKDVAAPTELFPLGSNTEDSAALMNFKQQVSITEGNNYVLTFPNGINTPRYMYMEELDLLAYTSADVISHGSDVTLTVYGETTDRTYRAYHANGAFNTNMRVLLLIAGSDIA